MKERKEIEIRLKILQAVRFGIEDIKMLQVEKSINKVTLDYLITDYVYQALYNENGKRDSNQAKGLPTI